MSAVYNLPDQAEMQTAQFRQFQPILPGVVVEGAMFNHENGATTMLALALLLNIVGLGLFIKLMVALAI